MSSISDLSAEQAEFKSAGDAVISEFYIVVAWGGHLMSFWVDFEELDSVSEVSTNKKYYMFLRPKRIRDFLAKRIRLSL